MRESRLCKWVREGWSAADRIEELVLERQLVTLLAPQNLHGYHWVRDHKPLHASLSAGVTRTKVSWAVQCNQTASKAELREVRLRM